MYQATSVCGLKLLKLLIKQCVEQVSGEFTPQDISNTLWAFATWKMRPGTQFTRFTSTTIQILTPEELCARFRVDAAAREAHRGGDAGIHLATHFKHLVGACQIRHHDGGSRNGSDTAAGRANLSTKRPSGKLLVY